MHALVLPPSSALLGVAAPFLSCRFSFHALHSRPLLPVTLDQLAVEEGTGKGGWVFIFSSFAHLVISGCDDQSEQLFGPSLPLPLRGVRMRLLEQRAARDEMGFWGAGGPTAEGSGHGAGLGLRAPPDHLPVSLPAPGRTPE